MNTHPREHFDTVVHSSKTRVPSGLNTFRGFFSRTIGAVALTCLFFVGLTPCWGQRDSTESYANSVFHLVEKHQASLSRLFAPADATANAITHGGSFYLGGDEGWIAEGNGRAGGLTMIRPLPVAPIPSTVDPKARATTPLPGTWLPATTQPAKGDVVWLGYSSENYAAVVKRAKELEDIGCVVVAFGPKLESGVSHFTYWIDSFTPPTADATFTRMGNIVSLWTMTAEVVASTSRQGKTLAFYQSDSVEGARDRNALYAGLAFHNGVPQMSAVPAGVLSKEYLAFIQSMLQAIHTSQLSKINAVGKELAKRAAAGNPAILMLIGHMMPSSVDRQSKVFRYMSFPAQRASLESQLQPGGYFVFLGYVSTYMDLWQAVRRDKATAVWIVSPLPTVVDVAQWHDTVIDQQWKIGDCAVEVPGYDVRILPPSGIAQLFIYELLVRAAEAK